MDCKSGRAASAGETVYQGVCVQIAKRFFQLAKAIVDFQELHVRFAKSIPSSQLSPFQSNVAPGLTVFVRPLRGVSAYVRIHRPVK